MQELTHSLFKSSTDFAIGLINGALALGQMDEKVIFVITEAVMKAYGMDMDTALLVVEYASKNY